MTVETAPPMVIALSVDLMDRSKLTGAFPEARIVRSVDALIEASNAQAVCLVDLSRVDDPSELTEVTGRVIGFGSHVNEAQLDAAHAVGIEALPRSLFFRRLGDGSLI